MTAIERVDVHYSGQVQGVGFRHTTTMLARHFEVTGFVQNLPDGRVRMVAEGEPGELQRLLDAIDQELGTLVRQRTIDRLSATGEFERFTIRH